MYVFQLTCVLVTVWQISAAADDCGVYGQPVPAPPNGSALMQVHTTIRHGDRVSYQGGVCWPGDEVVWSCSLADAGLPMYADTQYGDRVPRVYRRIFKPGVLEQRTRGNCSVGQLTKVGFMQQEKNGDVLRKAYVDSTFLKQNLSASEVYIRSDNYLRTQMSAEALMLEMFPPMRTRGGAVGGASGGEVVHLYTTETKYDPMVPNTQLCPKLGQYKEEFLQSKEYMDHYRNVTEPLLNKISKAVNFTVGDEEAMNLLMDCARVYRCHGYSWPQGLTEELYQEGWAEVSWYYSHIYSYPSVQANAQVGIGFLLIEFLEHMNYSVAGKEVEKFLLYSGHDTTVLPILVALQAFDNTWPLYASTLLLELYKTPSSASGHAVRGIYNGKVLEFPFCSNKTLCDYKEFSGYLASIVPTDPVKQCSAFSWH